MKYTYSDEEDDIYSDTTTSRRSTRNTGTHTPAEPSGPTVTQSGRQVKSRQGGAYGESILSGTQAPAITAGGFDGTSEEPEADGGRPRRAAVAVAANGWSSKGGRHIEGFNNVDEMTSDDEGDASEQDYGDDEEEDEHLSLESDVEDPDDLTDEDETMAEVGDKKQLIVKLPVKTPTPERKTAPRPQLSLEKESTTADHFLPTTANADNRASSTTVNTANVAAIDAKEKTKPASPFDVSEAPTKPMSIPPNSPSHQAQTTPLSPSLAFRGSPEKPTSFPQSINVGFGGS